MGEVKLTKAEYIVGTQTLDVMDLLEKIKDENYGAIELPMAKLDEDLRKDNRITTPADAEALRLTPPRLVVDYVDEKGIPHHIEKTGAAQAAPLPPAKEKFEDGKDTVAIGGRSTFGRLIQTPYEIFKDMGMFAARGSFLFGFALFWTVVVIWTYTQWTYICIELTPLEGAAGNPNEYTTENLGILSKYIVGLTALAMGALAALCEYLKINDVIARYLKSPPVYGWLMRGVMTITSGFAPIAGFFLQLMFWFTVVRPIEALKKNPAPTKLSDSFSKLMPM
jgi:hypothetical protein